MFANKKKNCMKGIMEREDKVLLEEGVAKGVFTVLNDRGLHTRPATELVRCARKFRAEISLVHKKLKVNAKSILGILLLAAPRGSRIKVEAEGDDAEEALTALLDLSKSKFHIEY